MSNSYDLIVEETQKGYFEVKFLNGQHAGMVAFSSEAGFYEVTVALARTDTRLMIVVQEHKWHILKWHGLDQVGHDIEPCDTIEAAILAVFREELRGLAST